MKGHLSPPPLNERIIFALDVSEPGEARRYVRALDSHLKFFKVGLQLFLAGGWPVIDDIVQRGNKVMIDLKFFDIPETVHLAVQELKNRGVTFATIHGNQSIIEAATSDKGELIILAVTVLTSFDESDMREMGLSGSIEELVLIRAKKALKFGCDGVVASPLETPEIRKAVGKKFLIVTPGIRAGLNIGTNESLLHLKEDDQKRIATARQAVLNGADHVVIGRPIRLSSNPLKTVQVLQEDISKGLALL